MSSKEPVSTYDPNGKCIYYKDSGGYEHWKEYDSNGKLIHYKNSSGYEEWWEFDSNGNQIHYKTSSGYERWYWEGKITKDPIKILILETQLHFKASQ
jgi:YD repeat-containing protein